MAGFLRVMKHIYGKEPGKKKKQDQDHLRCSYLQYGFDMKKKTSTWSWSLCSTQFREAGIIFYINKNPNYNGTQ